MRVNVLGITIDSYSMQEAVAEIRKAIEDQLRMRVVTANPEMIYESGKNSRLRELINSADLVTPDGIGVVWAAARLGTPVQERVTGIDLVQSLFSVADQQKWRIFFLGGKPGVALQAARQVALKYPGIVWEESHGYFNEEEEVYLLEKISTFQPDILLVGLGAPRQEYWNAEHPELAKVSIGVGGSFDALAGIVDRAPQRIQELKLEWLYRLWKEPWRWKRQTVLPRFVIKVLWQKIIT
ncbi:WecB/TagA/CpsF family glycosyltransferase [Desulfosporosinus hippei]|uniref:N-acetylglucosaminyldiphosphoundecaprenol N-acetyl-beta-D-mannosaminyltransferase n=1 Tax=Desulfosporosinus hippei DSM 8344 TaxID=1121419 RepID=A0A1G7XD61_9FIRM|nr:WecB/TagA/CpsF family glycosyltransferase [Desulfosporosinus hippei]SDG82126.1 N-acetylglucosaminyldiphosphoundecaprenol N-acetyl-beta-D-mannosaminyltransferase [Desulfosporosinus hippei DSM 8344]